MAIEEMVQILGTCKILKELSIRPIHIKTQEIQSNQSVKKVSMDFNKEDLVSSKQ
jgi:hypothetical protein